MLSDEQIYSNVIPSHYKLLLAPNFQSFDFIGIVEIEIEVLTATKEIILNAEGLEIHAASLRSDRRIEARKTCNTYGEAIIVMFDSSIVPGQYILFLTFKGKLNDTLRGFYRSKYVNSKGEDVYAAVTQFAATDARRCFPCWDEPAIKATFDISVTVAKGLVALSNMPVKSTDENDQEIRYIFERTPKMSTYLVAVAVGEYDYIENRSVDGVLVRVYTPVGKKEHGMFALDVATKVLPYYKEYFHIAYPLPKLDLLAVADLSFGAMEHWGLITFRESLLLVDPKNTSTESKQTIALTVGHEIAHQWFGNIVTMEWWTHLWLNEGYATFVEYMCVDYLFPEYKVWKQFVNFTSEKALKLDSLKSSHPIEVPVFDPSEIFEIFDSISYSKGAAVIRMLYHYIGDEYFRKGMHLYLTRHQYSNAVTTDLWCALEEESGQPIGEIMSAWTSQVGFPLISVSTKFIPEKNGVLLELIQDKFNLDGSKSDQDFLWIVPLSIFTSKSDVATNILLRSKQTEVFVPDVDSDDWIIINSSYIGFFRTKYTSDMLQKFIPAIQNKSLSSLDRLGLINDLFAIVQAGHTSTVEILKLLKAFEEETDYNVWQSIVNVLAKLDQLFEYTDFSQPFKLFQLELLKKIYGKLGWDSNPEETHLESLLRALILERIAWLDFDQSISEARKRFAAHIKSEIILPADIRSACFKTIMRSGGQEEFDSLVKLFRSTDLHEEKNRIGVALGASKNEELLCKTLDFIMSEEVRSQDKTALIISVAFTSLGREGSWCYCKQYWTSLSIDFNDFLLMNMIKLVGENFASEEMSKDMERFFKSKCRGTRKSVQQVTETIKINAAWLKRDSDAIRKYLLP